MREGDRREGERAQAGGRRAPSRTRLRDARPRQAPRPSCTPAPSTSRSPAARPGPSGTSTRSRSCARRSSASSAAWASRCTTRPRSTSKRTTSPSSASRPTTPRRTCRTASGRRTGSSSARTRATSQIRAMSTKKPPFAFVHAGRHVSPRRRRDALADVQPDRGVPRGPPGLDGKPPRRARRVRRALLRRRDARCDWRPSYFPFVEPGAEVDVACANCRQRDGTRKGCNVCKHTGWVEILGCGMIHPVVFEACGIDPEEWTGVRARDGDRADGDGPVRPARPAAALRERPAVLGAVLIEARAGKFTE